MPEQLREYFYLSQIGIGALFVAAGWFFLRSREGASKFRVREADLKTPGGGRSGKKGLAEARMTPAGKILGLPGIRLEGTPFEILGISENASAETVQRAYKDLMKRYHPDRVGVQPGSAQWKDAQKIAEIINRARGDALKAVGKRNFTS
jgi:DnaJ-domain-containing protein 1